MHFSHPTHFFPLLFYPPHICFFSSGLYFFSSVCLFSFQHAYTLLADLEVQKCNWGAFSECQMQDASRGFSFEKVILIFRKEVCKDSLSTLFQFSQFWTKFIQMLGPKQFQVLFTRVEFKILMKLALILCVLTTTLWDSHGGKTSHQWEC